MGDIVWNDRFNIGVEAVDKAHRKLFSIVRKLIALNEEEDKERFACAETIKYFKSYTEKHFAEEEAYMKSIHYAGYDMHKRLHDNLREITLPALEKELADTGYSPGAIRHFLGICIGWLTGHIMIEDHAISGSTAKRWVYSQNESVISGLERAIANVMQSILGLETRLVSEHYGGEDFGTGVFCRFDLLTEDSQKIQVFWGFEEGLILRVFSEILGKKLYKVDKTVLYAVKQLSQLMLKNIQAYFEVTAAYKLDKECLLSYEQLLRAFDREYPQYSLLFGTGGKGYFSFSVRIPEGLA